MQGKIEAVNRSKSGKTLGVKVGEVWYTSKNWELENKVGASITFEPAASEFNGKTMWWLNDYVEVGSSTTPADQAFDAAYAQHQPPPMGQPKYPANMAPASGEGMHPEPRQTAQKDRDASIVAQALTKACTGPGDSVQDVWERYVGFYSRYEAWNPSDDSLPY